MRILITGAKGFIGRNLAENLKNIRDGKNSNYPINIEAIDEFDIDDDPKLLKEYCQKADFVFHLAGVNRPVDNSEFMQGNRDFLSIVLDLLKESGNRCPVMLSSSVQASLDNDYGKSKKAGEDLLFDYAKQNDSKALIYRFPNVFGKWCRPNYNSAVATFCHHIANDLPITVNDRNTQLTLVYIDDVIRELIDALCGEEHYDGRYCKVPITYRVTLGEIVDLLYKFKEIQNHQYLIHFPKDSFEKKLFATYLSYFPKEKTMIDFASHTDERGSFTELIHTVSGGQFSINISKPGITKGQHWHNTKWEMFIVISGEALIQQRNIITNETCEFQVSGKKLQAVCMLPGYTHNIINLSQSEDLVTLMWANENFDPHHPDTFYEPV